MFRQSSIVFALAMLLIAGGLGSAYAESETTVVGQNDPTVDVQAVQDAVDHFDIVNLVGTFHFGDETTPYNPGNARGGIEITRPHITLRGEGKDATRIMGGGYPVTPKRPYFPTTIHVHADDAKIHGLTLDGYLGWAILVEGCQDFESIGVRITNGVPATDEWYRFGWYFGYFARVTGDVLIKDCEYKSVGGVVHWEDAICTVYGRCDANFWIINNTLEVGSRVNPDWNNDAIQVFAHERDPVANSVRIEGNTLTAAAGVFLNRNRRTEIYNNEIIATRFGLIVGTPTPEESQPCIVEKNNIYMQGGSAAMRCGSWKLPWASPTTAWACAMVVRGNTFSGNADLGFLLEGSAWGNRFVVGEDDLEAFTVTTAHVLLGPDTRDNLFGLHDGEDLVIVDQGTNNKISYETSNHPSFWGQIKATFR